MSLPLPYPSAPVRIHRQRIEDDPGAAATPTRVAVTPPHTTTGRRLLHAAAVLLGYGAIALWLTRPLLFALGETTPVPHPESAFDIPFNAWVMSWVTRALTTQPLALFSANIYHPMPDALAYTEHMLGSIPFFAPTFLVTGNPVLALNAMVLCGLVLSAAGAYWVTWRWTGSWPAATLAGLLFGFYPAHLRALGPNLQTLQYFPLILMCLERVLAGGGLRLAMCLTLALLGQCLASYYYAYPAVLATAFATAAVYVGPAPRPSRNAVLQVVLAVATTAIVMGAFSVPYFHVREGGIHTFYAFLSSFGTPPGSPLQLVQFVVVRLGPAAAALALVGAVLPLLAPQADAVLRRRVIILIAWVAVGIVLYAGPSMWIGGWLVPLPAALLRDYAPGFAALRDANRLFVSAEAALAVLAGVGVAALARSVAHGRRRTAMALGTALCGTLATAWFVDLSPLPVTQLDSGARVPPIYRSVATLDRGAMLELPISPTDNDIQGVRIQTTYEYFSIFHWQPLLNGYVSYWPPQFETVMAMARALPDERALANLVACTGVRWILLHEGALPPARLVAWRRSTPGLESEVRIGTDVVYRVSAKGNPTACRAGLSSDAQTSLEGTPRGPLPSGARRARLVDASAPATQRAKVVAAGRVRLQNPSAATWPGLGVGDAGLVHVTPRWLDASGSPLAAKMTSTPLPFDVRPGETIDVPVAIRAPKQPGDYLLSFDVEQLPDVPFSLEGDATAPLPIHVK